METIVGFTVIAGMAEAAAAKARDAARRVIARFENIESCTIHVGQTELVVWGHPEIVARVHRLHNGEVLVLAGSPQGKVSWKEVEDDLTHLQQGEGYELPWEGSVILLRVSADGKTWSMWNDWVGSIPVYYAQKDGERIASTLEPVVVAGMGVGEDDIFLPGLASLMINGHFLSDWTLYRSIKVVRADSYTAWDEDGCRWKRLWTVKPSDVRWASGCDELVDEMYELSREAILGALREHPAWILPLSSGLDSRLIAAVGAEAGVEMHAYSWGTSKAKDVVYAKDIARVLGIPWKRVDIGTDYLSNYTKRWAEMFGTGMHFHGMYQMAFLDALKEGSDYPIVSGFLGDALSGAGVKEIVGLHDHTLTPEVFDRYHTYWSATELTGLLRIPIREAIEQVENEIMWVIDSVPGAQFQKMMFLLLWSRVRFFTNFSLTLSSYWRGVFTPFLDRDYARFCLSLPRAVLDGRRLIGEVYRHHYGKLAVIPGTYGEEPYVRTGRYLALRRIAKVIPESLHIGGLRGFDDVPLHMDADCVQAGGQDALWPIYDAENLLDEWLDVKQLAPVYEAARASNSDIRPVRKLQAVQALAYLLLQSSAGKN